MIRDFLLLFHHLDGLVIVVSIEVRLVIVRGSGARLCEGCCARPTGDHEEQL